VTVALVIGVNFVMDVWIVGIVLMVLFYRIAGEPANPLFVMTVLVAIIVLDVPG